MKLSVSVKPISLVKTHMSEMVEGLTKTHGKVVITHNGEARAVLQDIESYEELHDSLAMLKIVAMSTKSMLEGKGESPEKAFNDIRKKAKETAAR
ncbi:MAG: type II toxin-antitoxin system Phd/YefM family antitoxin [Chitinivibrionales bacterium]|nr:type II toxin-antitoxin system Phd/YefM family antitoxin [Chitinivibrionales bacterium]